MVSINNLPVVTLTQDNIEKEWQELVNHIRTSTFISIDIVNMILKYKLKKENLFLNLKGTKWSWK